MRLNDVLTLLQAGYTKEQIEAFNEPDPAPAPAPEPEPAPAPEPEEPIQGADRYAALEAKLNSLMGIVQAQNLNTGVDTMPKRTAQDALANVIAPPRKEK